MAVNIFRQFLRENFRGKQVEGTGIPGKGRDPCSERQGSGLSGRGRDASCGGCGGSAGVERAGGPDAALGEGTLLEFWMLKNCSQGSYVCGAVRILRRGVRRNSGTAAIAVSLH